MMIGLLFSVTATQPAEQPQFSENQVKGAFRATAELL